MPFRPERAIVLAGAGGVGKTSACLEAVRAAAAAGLAAGGLVSPSRRSPEGLPLEVEALWIASGERRLLASRERRLRGPSWPPAGAADASPFYFSDEAFAWALGLLEGANDLDLLVLDEAGPVELELGRGFRPFLAAMAEPSDAARRGLLVVSARTALAQSLRSLLGPATTGILAIDGSSRDAAPSLIARAARELALAGRSP